MFGKVLCIILCHSLLLLWSNSQRVFCNIRKSRDTATICPIFVLVAATGSYKTEYWPGLLLFNRTVDFAVYIFSVKASNSILGLWCRYRWNVRVLSGTVVKAQCQYIVRFSRWVEGFLACESIKSTNWTCSKYKSLMILLSLLNRVWLLLLWCFLFSLQLELCTGPRGSLYTK